MNHSSRDLSSLFTFRREYVSSRMREILDACKMEITVAIFERMEGEKTTTKGVTLSPPSLPRNRQG